MHSKHQITGRKPDLLLIGPMPPPNGGVSIHMVRLARLIEDEFKIDFIDESRKIKPEYFNLRSLNFFSYINKIRKADVVYIHSGPSLLKKFHIVAGRLFFTRVILTIHSYPRRKKLIPGLTDSLFFSLADTIVVVNTAIPERISLPERKCIIKEAFIPPVMDLEPGLPSFISAWIADRRSAGRAIVCANASRLVLFDGLDLYGLDMCIEVAGRLKRKGYPFSFIYNVASLDQSRDMFLIAQSEIISAGLQEDFLLINENISFPRLIKASDIVLRPTNSDGDSLTVREALWLGRKVIASDVVQRPEGTILFRTGDSNDLEGKLTELAKLELQEYSGVTIGTMDEFRTFYADLIKDSLKSTLFMSLSTSDTAK